MKALALIAFFCVIATFSFASPVHADPPAAKAKCPQSGCLAGEPGDLNVPNVNVGEVSKGIIRILSFVAGAASVIFLVIGGLKYSSSSGNSQRVESAKQTIIYAVIGLILSVFASYIVGFVIASGP